MTDKELLELAAKAAGERLDKSPYNGGGGNDGFDVAGNAVLDWRNGTLWNPLTDDGDAFRLAVKLRLGLTFFAPIELEGLYQPGTVEVWREGDEDPIYVYWRETGDDPYAATRRAIVLAAAEIGKAM